MGLDEPGQQSKGHKLVLEKPTPAGLLARIPLCRLSGVAAGSRYTNQF